MRYTDINTIFTWFEEGDFPTAPQFQATFSSFYHKSENIPMAKIEGINDALGRYVLNDTFHSHLKDEKAHAKHLVKLDASNISEEYRTALRTALGVGDLPDNIATTDYVDENSKNVANSPQKTKEGAKMILEYPWELDANGQPLMFKNLRNAEGDDLFDKKIVINADGTFGERLDAPTVEVTIPDNLTINPVNPVDAVYTVNHVYPDPVPQLSVEFDNLKNFMATISNNDFIEMGDNDFTIASVDSEVRASVTNGVVNIIPLGGNELFTKTSVTSNIVLPPNKNWTIMLKTSISNHTRYARGFKIGFIRGDDSGNVNTPETAVLLPHFSAFGISGSGLDVSVERETGLHIIYTKVGRILNISVISETGEKESVNIDAMTFLGDYKLCFSAGTVSTPVDSNSYNNIKYWIEQ